MASRSGLLQGAFFNCRMTRVQRSQTQQGIVEGDIQCERLANPTRMLSGGGKVDLGEESIKKGVC